MVVVDEVRKCGGGSGDVEGGGCLKIILVEAVVEVGGIGDGGGDVGRVA